MSRFSHDTTTKVSASAKHLRKAEPLAQVALVLTVATFEPSQS